MELIMSDTVGIVDEKTGIVSVNYDAHSLDLAVANRQYIIYFTGDKLDQKEFEQMLNGFMTSGFITRWSKHSMLKAKARAPQTGQVSGLSLERGGDNT